MKAIGGNSGMVRQINRDLLRDALKAASGSTLAELARTTGLSVATCSNLMPELIESGEAVVLPSESQGGRPARRYAFNPNHTLVAAVILYEEEGGVVARGSVRNGNGDEIDAFVEIWSAFTLEDFDAMFARVLHSHSAIRAAALSISGVVVEGYVESCDFPGLTGINMEKHVEDRYGVKAIVENNMNFAAVGYYSANAKSIRSGLAYISFQFDFCPGMGLVLNGALFKGKSHFAGEIGNIRHDRNKAAEAGTARHADLERMADIVIATVTVINPDVVVLTGAPVGPGVRDAVWNICREWIPEQHMPRLVVREDCWEDYFAGMTAMALVSLSGEVKLVEKERLWCGL